MSEDVAPSEFATTRDRVVDEVVRFSRALRDAGVDVPANAATEATRALATVGFERDRARAALRATLVSRERDLETFEQLFPEFWRRLTAELTPVGPDRNADDMDQRPPESDLPRRGGETPSAEPGDPGEVDPTGTGDGRSEVAVGSHDDVDDAADGDGERTAVYSAAGRSRALDGEDGLVVTPSDLASDVRELGGALARLSGRRWGRRGDDRVATRRALRESLATGGALLDVPRTERAETEVTATFLVDVSQSVLDTVDRGFLLEFLRTATRQWRSARVFFFDTSVREVTDQFDADAVSDAVRALERAETEWGGGTRIGTALATVRERYPHAVDRETVVFVVSDGLEVGEIDELEDGMAWLSRLSPAVLWLNPLAATDAYEPTCRGMAAALPYVDGLFAFAGPDDVVELARQLSMYGTGRAIGYEQDPRRG